MKAEELKRRHVALVEYERIEKAYVGQSFLVPVQRGGTDGLLITAVDDPGHSPELSNLAHQCFAKRIAEGLTEYRAALLKIASVKDAE